MLVVVYCMTCQSVFAQQNSDLEAMKETQPGQLVETLQQKMQNSAALTPADHIYYQTLLSEAHYNLYQPDKALEHALIAVRLAEDDKQSELYQRALLSKAFALGLGAKAEESLPIAQAVLVWAREMNVLDIQVEALQSIGFSALSLADSTLALDAMQQAYSLLKKHQNQGLPHYARFASYLAQVYGYRKEPSHSLPLFLEASEYNRQQGLELELSDSLYGAARAYRQLGEPEQALSLLEESMALSRKHEDEQGAAYTLIEIASLKLEHPKFIDATLTQMVSDLQQARTLVTQAGNDYLMLEVDQILAELYLDTGEFDKALQALETAEDLIKSDSFRRSAAGFLRLEAQILAAKGDSALAYERLSEAYSAREKILTEKGEEEFERLRAEFNAEQQTMENQLLSEQNALQQVELDLADKQNTIVMLITLLLTAVVGCMLFFYRNLRVQKDRLARLASRDPLTGVDNRRAILQYLESVKQEGQGSIGVALLDLDNFKQINDTYGHQVGDEVLIVAAVEAKTVLNQQARIGRIGRIGGEEFLIVFNASVEIENCYDYLTHYMQQVTQTAQHIAILQYTPVTFSIGLTLATHNEAISDTLARADALMYQAKANGKNQIVLQK